MSKKLSIIYALICIYSYSSGQSFGVKMGTMVWEDDKVHELRTEADIAYPITQGFEASLVSGIYYWHSEDGTLNGIPVMLGLRYVMTKSVVTPYLCVEYGDILYFLSSNDNRLQLKKNMRIGLGTRYQLPGNMSLDISVKTQSYNARNLEIMGGLRMPL
jgi:hypothetical protein